MLSFQTGEISAFSSTADFAPFSEVDTFVASPPRSGVLAGAFFFVVTDGFVVTTPVLPTAYDLAKRLS
jgi:hypothetical protein